MQKKALITGASGFAGRYLVRHLAAKRTYQLFGTYLTHIDSALQSQHTPVEYIKLDLLDSKQTKHVIASVSPDYIFHLAAFSATADSLNNPKETILNNVGAQINLLEAVRAANIPKVKILIVSSADIYGIVKKEDLPIDEQTPFAPTNPYAVSKITQDFLALQYYLSYNMHIVRVRPFNHIGAFQSLGFVVTAFAKRIAEIEKGKSQPILRVGNLEAKRDFTHVADMVAAYDLALEKGVPGDVYNLGSGTSYAIKEILEKMLSFSTKEIKVEIDPKMVRVIDTPDKICDTAKFFALTGWKPTTPIEKALQEALDYWRNIV